MGSSESTEVPKKEIEESTSPIVNKGTVPMASVEPGEDIAKKMEELILPPEINILLLGETGVGKSTFINSLINYLQNANLDEVEKADLQVLIPSQFSVYDKDNVSHPVTVGKSDDKNELLEVGNSATQEVRTYTFMVKRTTTHSIKQVQIRLIDSPGMGDTRGIEQDNINCENILSHINRLKQLHAICYLCQPQQTRATVYFRYCMAQIMSRLHADACKNFVFVFTRTRGTGYTPGDTFQMLEKIAEEVKKQPANAKLPLENNKFCFENEPFRYLAATKQKIQFTKDQRQDYVKSWKISSEESWKLINYIVTLPPHNVANTEAVNVARHIIFQLSQPLAEIAQLVQDNITVLQRHRANMNMDRDSLSELKKKLYIPYISLEVTTLPRPVTVCTATKCAEIYKVGDKNEWHYKTRCHEPCYLTNVTKEIVGDPNLLHCAAMNGTDTCTKCSCKFSLHMHVYYMTKKVDSQKKDEIVLRSINTKEDIIKAAEKIINEVDQLKKQHEEELKIIIQNNAKFAHYLQTNAISAFSDSYEQYIKHLIVKEKSLGRDAVLKTLVGLETLLKQHQEQKKIFDETAAAHKRIGMGTFISTADIQQAQKEIFQLKLNGPKIKEMFNSQKKNLQKEYNFSEYKHHITFAQSPPKQAPGKEAPKEQHSRANPTTKFQRGRPQRGGYPNRSHSRPRTPPPAYNEYDRYNRPARGPQEYRNVNQPQSSQPQASTSGKGISVNVTVLGPGETSTSQPSPDQQNTPRQDYRYPNRGEGYHPGDAGYPRDHGYSGYPPRDPGYRPGDPGYPPRDPGYPPRDPGYPPRDSGYPPRDSGYPPRDPAYPPRDPGYPPRDPGYPPRDPGYPPRDQGYPPRDPPYPPSDSRYPPRDPGYPPRDPDYPPRGHEYPSREYGYPPRNNQPPNQGGPRPQERYNARNHYQHNQNTRGGRGGFKRNFKAKQTKGKPGGKGNDGNDSDASQA